MGVICMNYENEIVLYKFDYRYEHFFNYEIFSWTTTTRSYLLISTVLNIKGPYSYQKGPIKQIYFYAQ